jgi:NAD(P)-dependent dehydrogenase (short-subunit alcohol dehydrogenase family)
MNLGIRDRACIVTGGSRGIGLEVARQLITEHARVLILGRNDQALQAATSQLGPDARRLALDVTAADAGERAVSACLEHFGRLDVLVNGASTTAVRAIEQLTDADWQEQWEINVMAPMRMMRAALPVMTSRGWGRVVNVSSSSGKRPGQRNVAYSVAKAAELALSRAYAEAYAKHGVLINAVTPGPVEGDLWLGPGGLAEQTAEAQHKTKEEVLEAAAQALPIGRLATAHEIANVIVFLCSELASNVTGAAWSVDGGAVPVII